MTRTILTMFFEHGGYLSDSSYSAQDDYIAISDVTSTYVPQALLFFNHMCNITRSVNYSSMTSGNLVDDLIITELALSIADSEYDKLHVDPQSMEVENKHGAVAKEYMLNMYGVQKDRKTVLPFEASGGTAYKYMGIATLSF